MCGNSFIERKHGDKVIVIDQLEDKIETASSGKSNTMSKMLKEYIDKILCFIL